MPLSLKEFESFRRKAVKHYQERLDYRKRRGEQLKGKAQVDGGDLEYGFAYIARLAGSKKRNLFHGDSGWFELTFGPKQRRALLTIIDTIENDVYRDIPLAQLLLHHD
jgi:hypothetical protein